MCQSLGYFGKQDDRTDLSKAEDRKGAFVRRTKVMGSQINAMKKTDQNESIETGAGAVGHN